MHTNTHKTNKQTNKPINPLPFKSQ